MKRVLLILVMIIPVLGPVWTQDLQAVKPEPATQEFSYVLADVSFISDAVFMGRRDTVPAPYLMPSLGYYHKSGAFADASFSYLISQDDARVDLAVLTAGIIFGKGRMKGTIAGTAYFFNEASYNVRSETVGNLTGLVSYTWGTIESSLQAMTYFNRADDPDIFTGFTLGKALGLKNKTWVFRPTASVFAGTQNYYEAYYNTSRLGNRKSSGRGNNLNAASTALVRMEEVTKFKLLNLELALPVSFFKGQFIFSATPSLALPQSPAKITGTDIEYTEDLKPSFYFMTGVSYWF